MLEMKVVLRGALRTLTLQPAERAEVARRRNITVRPSGGARAVLSARQAASVAV
jgi:hypothetical protein